MTRTNRLLLVSVFTALALGGIVLAGGAREFRRIALERGQPHRLERIDQIEFSADGKLLFIAAHRVEDRAFVRDPETGLPRRKGGTSWIECWNTATWKKVATIQDLAAPFAVVGNANTIVALPGRVAQFDVFAKEYKLAVYDLKKQKITRHFDAVPGYVSGIACAPNGTSVISCSTTISVDPSAIANPRSMKWANPTVAKTTNYVDLRSIDGRAQWQHRLDSGGISAVEWSPDGSLVLGAGRGGVFAWNAKTGKATWQQQQYARTYQWQCLACSRDGKYVISGGSLPSYAVLTIHSLKDGKPIRTVNLLQHGTVQPHDLAIAPDGRLLAVALGNHNKHGQNSGEVRIVHVVTGKTLKTLLKDHPQAVTTVAYSPDGRFLAAGTEDGWVELWNLPSGGQ